ncbi:MULTISPECIES: hypothetical protein [Lacticaseibacillus]|uniref:Uncharacterized protein n=2 Tax=Lacticaseibacillus TaxID=2759736 RepID=A0AAN1EZN1_LACCA|nr:MULTISPECIES: hypothetical protein [Lacticaseibacillus]ARY92061.1 hypothetical protein BGL52_09985 [Lacticaseibacillus casei]KAB1971111.1 hypothetical protein F9B82_01070 [Lacticaseibacillus casei]WLV79967.1 hypothetical protein LACSTY_002009 [Lacticaseibacillus sp. NCIMB 15473]WNX26237.1 hypothetical protein RWA15_09760 [Lacticaseibacillus casei]WNX29012.1 hypothetical protein RWA16_09765 [Lacticaseibacillus casei]
METTQRRALSLMLLGDFETAVFWLKAPSQRSSPSWPEIAEFGTTRNFVPTFFEDHSQYNTTTYK